MNTKLFKRVILLFILCFCMVGCNLKTDNTKTSNISTLNELTNTEITSAPTSKEITTTITSEIPEIQVNEDEIPYGFDDKSYSLYKSGVLDKFIPAKSEVDQCVIADLDTDGIQDVLLSISIPEFINPNDIHSNDHNTLILKGFSDGTYKMIAQNRNLNYDFTTSITAGSGWFKFTSSRGTAGGYEYDFLFTYNKEKNDCIYSEYYYNNYGDVVDGISLIQTKENFGNIFFSDFDENKEVNIKVESNYSQDSLSVNEKNFVVQVSSCKVVLQDKKKELKVNQLIAEDLKLFINDLRKRKVNTDIKISGIATFETPEVISIEYNIFSTIYSDDYSGANNKYFTTTIDINKMKRIKLADVIDIEKLVQIVKERGFSDESIVDSKSANIKYNELPNDELLKLLQSCDSFGSCFSTQNTGIFCALHEKSICLYFQPKFFGMGPYSEKFNEKPKLYIPIENVLSYVKVPFWSNPSKASSHIVWKG